MAPCRPGGSAERIPIHAKNSAHGFSMIPLKPRYFLEEAGYDQSKPLTFDVYSWVRGGAMVPFLAGQVETVLDYWRAIGVQANLKLTEQTAFQAMFRSKTWKGVMAGATVGAGQA